MAKKPTLTTLTSGHGSAAKHNANYTAIEDAFDNTLSLDGSTPNAMNADLDLNSNDLNNVGTVTTTSLVLNGTTITASVSERIDWKGAWATSTAYTIGDAVSNNGASYICTTNHTASASDQPGVGGSWTSYWDLLAQKGTDGAGAGDLVSTNNLSDVSNAATSLSNLGGMPLTGGQMSGTDRWDKGADVASASGLTLGTDGNSFDITGTTAITSIGSLGLGTVVILQFDGALTLQHNATDLVLPNGVDITTAAGDIGVFYEYASGDWRCVSFQRQAGIQVGDLADGTDGELITWDAAGAPATVPVGTSGQVLTSNGAGAAPTFQAAAGGGALIFIASTDASASSTIDFTGFVAGTYDSYMFELMNVIPATDDVELWVRTSTDGGSSYDNGASDYAWGLSGVRGGSLDEEADGSDNHIRLTFGSTATQAVGSGSNEDGVSGRLYIHGPHLTKRTQVTYNVAYENANGDMCFVSGGGVRFSSADVDAVRFLFQSGNIESGTITMYGLKNA